MTGELWLAFQVVLNICGHKSTARPVSMVVKFFCGHILLLRFRHERRREMSRNEVYHSGDRGGVETEKERKLL